MTRKRLYKLIMSKGYQRNSAQRLVEQAAASGLSYREWWDKYEKYIDKAKWQRVGRTLVNMFSNIMAGIVRTAENMRKPGQAINGEAERGTEAKTIICDELEGGGKE